MQRAPLRLAAAAGPQETPTSERTTVYVCEDVPSLRLVVRLTLELEPGLDVVGEAGDGATALREIAAVRPDVVVLDLSLPERDGLEVLDELPSVSPGSRVVVFSGYREDVAGAEALARGACAYVEKGADPAVLAETVRRVAGCRSLA